MAYVFLSHAHEDKPFARKLAADLRSAGHAVWIDEAEIKVGDSLIDKITAGLGEVDFVAALLSQSSINSPWVKKELDIASNKELRAGKVVVLPLLLADVEPPGFLQGKLYADFRTEDAYKGSFAQLLHALGPAEAPPPVGEGEIAELRAELAAVRAQAKREATAAHRAGEAAFRAKSDKLKAAIEKANAEHPSHAPINRTHAFEIDGVAVTLDYALWALGKSLHRGFHVLEALLTISNRWQDIESMFEAYSDMIEAGGS